jgi:hypothetical protein
LHAEIEHLDLSFVNNIMELAIEPMLEQEICKGQLEDEKLKDIAENVVLGRHMSLGWMRMVHYGLQKKYVYLN